MSKSQNFGDQDAHKGAVEGDGRERKSQRQSGNTSLAGQNPHRTESNFVKSHDSDFPEPGLNPEHSGQKQNQLKAVRIDSDREQTPAEGADIESGRSPERDLVNQDPGHRQKRNQNESKDDPLAA